MSHFGKYFNPVKHGLSFQKLSSGQPSVKPDLSLWDSIFVWLVALQAGIGHCGIMCTHVSLYMRTPTVK